MHVQALRSLGRINSNKHDDIVNRDVRLQLDALTECLNGTNPRIKHSRLIRAEAAHAIANWQNDRAPRLLLPIEVNLTTVETKQGEPTWSGMAKLISTLNEWYANDADGKQKMSHTDAHMRKHLLLAIGSIKSSTGETPMQVIEVLLQFGSRCGVDEERELILLSLARAGCSNKKEKAKILEFAKATIQRDWAEARVKARLSKGTSPPRLAHDGRVCAAALLCCTSDFEYARTFLTFEHSSIVRVAALECIARGLLLEDEEVAKAQLKKLQQQQQQQQQAEGAGSTSTLSLTLGEKNRDRVSEAVGMCLKMIKMDCQRQARREAARVLASILYDHEVATHNDLFGFKLKKKTGKQRREAVRAELNNHVKAEWLSLILVHGVGARDQTIRSILLTLWLYIFGGNARGGGGTTVAEEEDVQQGDEDEFFGDKLSPWRLKIRDPYDTWSEYENSLRQCICPTLGSSAAVKKKKSGI